MYAQVTRVMASEVKALFRYLTEEAQALGLEFLRGLAIEIVYEVAKYDRSMKQLVRESEARFERWEEEGLTHAE